MSEQIELKIDATKLTPEKFVNAAKSFFLIVEGVASNFAGEDDTLQLVVEVDKGSAILRGRATNPTAKADQVIDAVCSGLRSLQSGSRTIPNWFTIKEVQASKNLGDLIDGEHIQSIFFKNGAGYEPLSKRLSESADAILNAQCYQAFGSVEGKIDSISDKNTLICSITDSIYQREITCYFTNTEAAEEAVIGFRKRVLADGLIRYGKDGRPTSISVHKIRIFPDESDLPTVEQVQEIYQHYA